MDVKTKKEETYTYDAVIICNGHYSVPYIPDLKGSDKFKGKQWHSHDYREPSCFMGKKVMLVGAGPSGVDIAAQIQLVANKVQFWQTYTQTSHQKIFEFQVYLSHSNELKATLADGIIQKPYLTELTETGAIFQDGTQETVDEILYCTGRSTTKIFSCV